MVPHSSKLVHEQSNTSKRESGFHVFTQGANGIPGRVSKLYVQVDDGWKTSVSEIGRFEAREGKRYKRLHPERGETVRIRSVETSTPRNSRILGIV